VSPLALAIDALLLLAAVCVGIAVHSFLGAGATWLYAGLALLGLWYALARPSVDRD
jgi:hypothetical protein